MLGGVVDQNVVPKRKSKGILSRRREKKTIGQKIKHIHIHTDYYRRGYAV
jgi:hypothetical protein